jgi:hypothetical protein
MKIGSVIAYEGGDNKIYYAEVLDSFIFWNGENGLRINTFENHIFDIFESDAWLLADNL